MFTHTGKRKSLRFHVLHGPGCRSLDKAAVAFIKSLPGVRLGCHVSREAKATARGVSKEIDLDIPELAG